MGQTTTAKLKHKRGTEASMPTLADGQLYLCTDTEKIYKGKSGTNICIGDIKSLVENTQEFCLLRLTDGSQNCEGLNVTNNVLFDNVEKTSLFNYDQSTGEVTFNKSGLYEVSVSLRLVQTTTNGTFCYLAGININGQLENQNALSWKRDTDNGGMNTIWITTSAILKINKNSKLKITISSNITSGYSVVATSQNCQTSTMIKKVGDINA